MTRSQLKVSTKAREALQKRKKIREYLKDEPSGSSPKVISSYTEINHNTVKSLLIEMVKDGELKHLERPKGYYALVDNTTHSIFSWCFQNLVITFEFDDLNIPEDIEIKSPEDEIINYSLLICKSTKKATFRLDTSYPQPILALIPVIWLFQKLILLKCDIEPALDKISIATVEFNQDDSKLRIDGAKAITYTECMDQIKIYNKENCARKEIKTTMPFTGKTLFELLHGGSVALKNALSNSETFELIRDLRSQLKVDRKTNRELFKMLLQKDNKEKVDKSPLF